MVQVIIVRVVKVTGVVTVVELAFKAVVMVVAAVIVQYNSGCSSRSGGGGSSSCINRVEALIAVDNLNGLTSETLS